MSKPHPTAYDVFLSYSQADDEVASALVEAFERRGLRVWNWADLLPGDRLDARLEEGLQSSHAIVLLVSPSWRKSVWGAFELGAALSAVRSSPERRLIPILLDTTPADLPGALRVFSAPILTDSNLDEISDQIARTLHREGVEASPPSL